MKWISCYHFVGLTAIALLIILIRVTECIFDSNLLNSTGCSSYGECSQVCEHPGCSCLPEFRHGVNTKTCELIDPQWKLIISENHQIGYLELDSWGKLREKPIFSRNLTTEVYSGFTNGPVTFDARNQLVYWAGGRYIQNTHVETIFRSPLDPSGLTEPEVLASVELVQDLFDIAFDWIGGNVYIVDNADKIIVCRNDSFEVCAVAIYTNPTRVTSLVLHPNLGVMFWVEYMEKSAFIVRWGMDGSSRVRIVTSDITFFFGLTIDQGNGRIYWMDNKFDSVQSVKLDGTDLRILPSLRKDSPSTHFFGVDILGDTLFFMINFPESTIQSMNKFTGADQTILHAEGDYVTFEGMAVFHLANQPILRENPCTSSQCEHICVLSPNGFSCLCPEGKEVSANGTSCKIATSTMFNFIVLSVLLLICLISIVVLLKMCSRTKTMLPVVKAR